MAGIRFLIVALALPAVSGLHAAEPATPVPSSAAEVQPIEVGSRVPDATLKTPAGEPFDLGRAVAKQPSILIFYRGGW